jgi:CheY-like chemotaxis protein
VWRGAGEKVLLIDADPLQREIGAEFLTFLGYTPIAVTSGEEAIEFLQHDQVDLIILDMIMEPGINGRETYENILLTNPDQRAIIVSGYSEHKEISKTMALGAGRFLKKPYTMEKLAVAVDAELS